jgi:putative membrane protein
MLSLALLLRLAEAHTGIILPWDSDELDYAQAPPDAWKVFDLHVSVLLGTALFTGLYFMAIGPWRKKYGWSAEPVELWRKVAFVIGQLILLISLNGPIHHLSDYYLFAAHMLQHLFLNLLWAPLTVVALPSWLVEKMLEVGPVRRLSNLVGGLPAKFLIYNGVLYFWHIPYMYDFAIANHNVHIVEHLSFMGTAVIAWVGLLCDAPSLPRPQPLAQLLYLFAMTLPMKLLGAIITLSDNLLYKGYLPAPRIWGLDPITDQHWGGLMMWLPSGLVMWASMVFVFSRWWEQEKASQIRVLPPPEVPS